MNDFALQHEHLRSLLEVGDYSTFLRELEEHARKEERAVYRWLRPALDPMGPPWLERSLVFAEVMELAGRGDQAARMLFERLVELEEGVLFPLADRLRPGWQAGR